MTEKQSIKENEKADLLMIASLLLSITHFV